MIAAYGRAGIKDQLVTLTRPAPLLRRVEAHVFAAERWHGDDTTVPVLATGKTDTGRCWVYVRDDRPFGGTGPPAAMFYYSRDRGGEHPQTHLAGNADAYGGYNKLYEVARKPGPIVEVACCVHARRFQATLGKEFLHVAVAQREAQVQPDGVLDDDRRKAMPTIGNRRHDRSLRPGRYRGPARYLDKALAADRRGR
jgi:hypothetical protein